MIAILLQFISTTLLYSLIFITTLFFTNIAQKNEKKKIIFLFFSVLAILIPSIFAGFRGLNVGTDIKVYALPEYNKSLIYGNLLDYINNTETDIGYAVLVWLCSHIGKRFNVLLTFTALLQIVPIYITAYIFRTKLKMWHVLFVYLTLNYVVGFNVMRQSMSAGFILLTFTLVHEKKYFFAIISFVIAQSFHSSTILGVGIILVCKYICSIKNVVLKLLILVVCPIVFVCVVFYWENIFIFAISRGFLPQKYYVYLNVFNGTNIGLKSYMFDIALSQYIEIFLKLIYYLVPLYFIAKNKQNDKFTNEINIICFVACLINLLVLFMFHSAYGYRIAIHLEYFLILFIPLSISKKECVQSDKTITAKQSRWCVTYSFFFNSIMLVMSFCILFAFFGQHETLPFYFQIYN